MQCPRASELMSLKLDNQLSPGQDKALDQHLSDCETCRFEWQMMRETAELFEDVSLAEPAPMFSDGVMTRVRRRSAWISVLRGGVALVLGIVILLAAGIIPIKALSLVSLRVSSSPLVISTIVGLFVRMVKIIEVLIRAGGLVVGAVFGAPNYIVLLTYALLCVTLSVGWIRLLLWPRPLATQQRRSMAPRH